MKLRNKGLILIIGGILSAFSDFVGNLFALGSYMFFFFLGMMALVIAGTIMMFKFHKTE